MWREKLRPGPERLVAISEAGSFSFAALEEIWIICCLAPISWEAAGPGNLWFEHQCGDQIKWLLVVECVARTTDNHLLSQMTHLELAPQPSDCIQLMKWVAFPGIGWFFLSCAGCRAYPDQVGAGVTGVQPVFLFPFYRWRKGGTGMRAVCVCVCVCVTASEW